MWFFYPKQIVTVSLSVSLSNNALFSFHGIFTCACQNNFRLCKLRLSEFFALIFFSTSNSLLFLALMIFCRGNLWFERDRERDLKKNNQKWMFSCIAITREKKNLTNLVEDFPIATSIGRYVFFRFCFISCSKIKQKTHNEWVKTFCRFVVQQSCNIWNCNDGKSSSWKIAIIYSLVHLVGKTKKCCWKHSTTNKYVLYAQVQVECREWRDEKQKKKITKGSSAKDINWEFTVFNSTLNTKWITTITITIIKSKNRIPSSKAH